MTKIPNVAVVILNWNGRNFLESFLPSVIASTYPRLEIIVADNASTDQSIEFLKAVTWMYWAILFAGVEYLVQLKKTLNSMMIRLKSFGLRVLLFL